MQYIEYVRITLAPHCCSFYCCVFFLCCVANMDCNEHYSHNIVFQLEMDMEKKDVTLFFGLPLAHSHSIWFYASSMLCESLYLFQLVQHIVNICIHTYIGSINALCPKLNFIMLESIWKFVFSWSCFNFPYAWIHCNSDCRWLTSSADFPLSLTLFALMWHRENVHNTHINCVLHIYHNVLVFDCIDDFFFHLRLSFRFVVTETY